MAGPATGLHNRFYADVRENTLAGPLFAVNVFLAYIFLCN